MISDANSIFTKVTNIRGKNYQKIDKKYSRGPGEEVTSHESLFFLEMKISVSLSLGIFRIIRKNKTVLKTIEFFQNMPYF